MKFDRKIAEFGDLFYMSFVCIKPRFWIELILFADLKVPNETEHLKIPKNDFISL